jgi:rhodanese-related sulfurtransferase
MALPSEITVPQLARLIGTPDAPIVIDVRIHEDYALDPRMIPGSFRRAFRTCQEWALTFAGKRVVVSSQRGLKLSQGVAALLRHAGADAVSLEGGFEAWLGANELLVKGVDALPRDLQGRSLWVTRARPKVDRVACPWLIRRFVDPQAVFLYVAASEVEAVADRFGAAPFDVDGVFWSHRGPVGTAEHTCSFDTMLDKFGLSSPVLDRLALIVRAADTAQHDLEPQAAGFLAVSLGLSRMFRDDLAQLDAGMLIYDAFHRWCRDGTEETHNWPNPAEKS